MSDTLYMQTDMNILVKHPHVYLQDIARLSCTNTKALNRLRVLPVTNLNPDTPGRYIMSVTDLVDLIQKKEPDLDIGAAFSIMTFNTDVDVGTLFKQIYQQVTGNISSGFTILEISYSIGLAAGVLFFFNHFGKKKFSADPTPMQVQMRQYEDDVNTTLLEESSRKKTSS